MSVPAAVCLHVFELSPVFIHSVCVRLMVFFPLPANSWFNSDDKKTKQKKYNCLQNLNLCPQCWKSLFLLTWSICVFHCTTGIKLNKKNKKQTENKPVMKSTCPAWDRTYCICTTESFWVIVVTMFNVAFSFSLPCCNVVNDLYNMT